jgi:ubiquinone biosynthesis protein UbiJ
MLVALLNRMLAQSLERSPRARELCTALAGRRLSLEVSGLPTALQLSAAAGGLQAAFGDGAGADVTVRGSPLALLAMAGADAREAVTRGAASFEGDELLAQQFQELARLLRPDLEHALGGVVGRMPAHFAARSLQQLGDWSRGAFASLARNGADYLAHESRDLVPRAEAESFLGGVGELRGRLVSAEARAERLEQQLDAGAPPAPRPGR